MTLWNKPSPVLLYNQKFQPQPFISPTKCRRFAFNSSPRHDGFGTSQASSRNSNICIEKLPKFGPDQADTPKLPYHLIIIVDYSSAILDHSQEFRLPLDGDHSSIVKYPHHSDHNYLRVSESMGLMVKQATIKSTLAAFLPLPVRDTYFRGRDELLNKLRELLIAIPNHRISLYGLGGVGKTQVATEYVYKHESDYKHIFWISASRLQAALGEIARATQCISKYDNASPDTLAKAGKIWMEGTENWLLVIDNLDNVTIVDSYLPSTKNGGHILITTRNKHVDSILDEVVEVPMLGSEDCVQLLLDRSGLGASENRKDAERIVKQLGCLPLAIQLAGAYIHRSQNLKEYLRLFSKQRRELLEWSPVPVDKNHVTVATIWKMSFEELGSSYPDSISLIQYLAFLSPDEIPLEFLVAAKDAVGPTMQTIFGNEFRLRKSLNELERFSLIRVFGGGDKISIHRLVQAVIVDDLKPRQRDAILSEIIGMGLHSFPDMKAGNDNMRDTCRRYRSQVVASLEHQVTRETVSDWFGLAYRLARYLREDGYYSEAVQWRKSIYEVAQKAPGMELVDTLWSLNDLAAACYELGCSDESLHIHEEILKIKERDGTDERSILLSKNNVAVTLLDLGANDEAKQLFEEVLPKLERIIQDPHDGDVLLIKNNLGVAFLAVGEPVKAAYLLEDVLKQRKLTLGPRDPRTLSTMSHFGSAYHDMGMFEEAAKVHEKVLEIRKDVLGPKHPSVLLSMNNLALSWTALGRSNDADQLRNEILKISRVQERDLRIQCKQCRS